MRIIPFVISALLLFGTVCTVSAATTHQSPAPTSQSSFTEAEAISKVEVVIGTEFPKKRGTVNGKIREGGPAPGRTIPAVLQTKVKKNGLNSYLVTCTERWNAKDFGGNGGTTNKSTLEHHWTYKVTPNATALVSQGGDFPPQQVR